MKNRWVRDPRFGLGAETLDEPKTKPKPKPEKRPIFTCPSKCGFETNTERSLDFHRDSCEHPDSIVARQRATGWLV